MVNKGVTAKIVSSKGLSGKGCKRRGGGRLAAFLIFSIYFNDSRLDITPRPTSFVEMRFGMNELAGFAPGRGLTGFSMRQTDTDANDRRTVLSIRE
jgi:hypothetical protein